MAVRANPNLKQRTLMVAGMAAVIIAVMVVSQVRQTYNATVAVSRRDVQQLSQILEANIDITFQSAELIIDHAVEKVVDLGPTPARPQLIANFIDIADNWPLIHSVALIGIDGKLEAAVLRREGKLVAFDERRDVSTEPLFLTHSKALTPGDRVYVTKPGRDLASGEQVIAMTKAVHDAHGGLRGVCIVTVAVDTFTGVFEGLLPARYTSVELFRHDAVLLASTKDRKPELTENEKTLFKEDIPLASSGVYRLTTPDSQTAPGGDTLFAYRVLQRYPIVVSVTADWDRMLKGWRENSEVLIAAALFGLLVIAALTAWLIRRIGAEQVAQQALAASERSLLESQLLSGVGYFERGVKSYATTWSDNMFDIHGMDPATFLPSHAAFLDLVQNDDRDKVEAVREALDTGREPVGTLECQIEIPGRGLRHIHYSWKVLEDGEREPRVFGVAQDVTAMRKAEDTIREDEQRLRDIAECSSDYIWEMDAVGTVTQFSGPGMDNLPGIIKSRVLDLKRFTPDTEAGDRAEVHRRITNREKFRSLLIPILNEAGEQLWLRLSGNPRFDAAGKYVGYRGAGTDVTELRRRHEYDEVGRRAEALGRLASGLAHEINNQLQPIVIYANFGVSQANLAENIRQYFIRIGRAAERSMLIVRNVLAYARQSPPSRENVNVLDVVRETIDFIGGTLGSGLVLDVSDRGDDLSARVDRTGLGQVLTNLITNAADAMPGGGRIGVILGPVNLYTEAAAELGLTPGIYCRLAVEDNGPGISAGVIGQVFDPFFTTKPQGRGTGLGLSVVAGLAKSWGGTVTAESTPGLRTCFTLYLPVAERQMQAAQ